MSGKLKCKHSFQAETTQDAKAHATSSFLLNRSPLSFSDAEQLYGRLLHNIMYDPASAPSLSM